MRRSKSKPCEKISLLTATDLQDPSTSDSLTRLLQMIRYTQEDEVSCDEFDRFLDEYAELARNVEDMHEIMPLVKNHIDLCPECKEEFEALMRILGKSQA